MVWIATTVWWKDGFWSRFAAVTKLSGRCKIAQSACAAYESSYAEPARDRTWNLRFRRPTPYPLGHRLSRRSLGIQNLVLRIFKFKSTSPQVARACLPGLAKMADRKRLAWTGGGGGAKRERDAFIDPLWPISLRSEPNIVVDRRLTNLGATFFPLCGLLLV